MPDRRRTLASLLLAAVLWLPICQGAGLTFCLHVWFDLDDACTRAVAVAEASSCCQAPRSDGPAVEDMEDCDRCCLHVAGAPSDLAQPSPAPDVPPATLVPAVPAPVRSAPALTVAREDAFARAHLPPPRVPTPLRI